MADPSPRFATTHWSMVLRAGGPSDEGRQALERLCRSYWYPLYAYARRRGMTAAAAEDGVQGFFTGLLERGALAKADPERGRFRSFLLTSFQNHLANEARRERAAKRGGGRRPLSLDDAESRFAREPSHQETPERIFLRDWALTVLDAVLARLRRHYVSRGQEALFEALKGRLTGGARDHAEVAAELGMEVGAVRTATSRLRKRYRELLREEVAQTIDAEDVDVEAELNSLLEALTV